MERRFSRERANRAANLIDAPTAKDRHYHGPGQGRLRLGQAIYAKHTSFFANRVIIIIIINVIETINSGVVAEWWQVGRSIIIVLNMRCVNQGFAMDEWLLEDLSSPLAKDSERGGAKIIKFSTDLEKAGER